MNETKAKTKDEPVSATKDKSMTATEGTDDTEAKYKAKAATATAIEGTDDTEAKYKAKTAVKSEWDVKLKIRLDKSLGGDRKSVFTSVNGKKYMVPTGKEVEVPLPIYEQLQKMQVEMDRLEDLRTEMSKSANKE